MLDGASHVKAVNLGVRSPHFPQHSVTLARVLSPASRSLQHTTRIHVYIDMSDYGIPTHATSRS